MLIFKIWSNYVGRESSKEWKGRSHHMDKSNCPIATLQAPPQCTERMFSTFGSSYHTLHKEQEAQWTTDDGQINTYLLLPVVWITLTRSSRELQPQHHIRVALQSRQRIVKVTSDLHVTVSAMISWNTQHLHLEIRRMVDMLLKVWLSQCLQNTFLPFNLENS